MLRAIIENAKPIDWIEGVIGVCIGLFGMYTTHQGLLWVQRYHTLWFTLVMALGLALIMYGTTWLIGDGKFNKVGKFLKKRNKNKRRNRK